MVNKLLTIVTAFLFLSCAALGQPTDKKLENFFWKFSEYGNDMAESRKTWQDYKGVFLNSIDLRKLGGEVGLLHNLVFLQHRQNVADATARPTLSEAFHRADLLIHQDKELRKFKHYLVFMRLYFEAEWENRDWPGLIGVDVNDKREWESIDIDCSFFDKKKFNDYLKRVEDFDAIYLCGKICESGSPLQTVLTSFIFGYQSHLLNQPITAKVHLKITEKAIAELSSEDTIRLENEYISISRIETIIRQVNGNAAIVTEMKAKSPFTTYKFEDFKEKQNAVNLLQSADLSQSIAIAVKDGVTFTEIVKLYDVDGADARYIFKKIKRFNKDYWEMDKTEMKGLRLGNEIPNGNIRLPTLGAIGVIFNPGGERLKKNRSITLQSRSQTYPNSSTLNTTIQ